MEPGDEASIRVLHHNIYIIFNTLRFLLSIRLCVCDGCGCGRNEFAGQHLPSNIRCIACMWLVFRCNNVFITIPLHN